MTTLKPVRMWCRWIGFKQWELYYVQAPPQEAFASAINLIEAGYEVKIENI